MALPLVTSRNQLQKIPTIALNLRKVLSGGTDGDFYTVPTGKKAIFKGFAVCTGFGAATTVSLLLAGTVSAIWNQSGGTDNQDRPRVMSVNVRYTFEVRLDAGDLVQYTQNSGTNGEMNMNAEILETPA